MKSPLFIFIISIFCLSCSKVGNNVKTTPISAITIVNAVIGANPLIADLTGADSVKAYYSTTPQIGYSSFQEYSIPSGLVPVVVYQITDTSHSVFKGSVKLLPSTIYSLFISGIYNNQNLPDTLFTIDYPPYHTASDSSVGIRFVNLSPGSSPISIDIQGNSNGSEVNSLAYKSITAFKNYPATMNIMQYTFEIRDAASGNLLTTYTYYLAPYQNITVAVIGSEDPNMSAPISAMQVNDY